MYQCHIHFYLTGSQCDAFETIRNTPPLAHFTHEFSDSGSPEKALAAGADVILANLQNMDVKETLGFLLNHKKEKARLILLADKSQVTLLTEFLREIQDIWIMPMKGEEASFRFSRWQQEYKMGRDFWQAGQYLDAAINNSPNLIW